MSLDPHTSLHRHKAGQYALAVVSVLATFAVVIGIVLGTAGFVRTTQLAEANKATLAAALKEREARSIANAEAVVRGCANDNRQADYNDFLLNELIRSANKSPEPSTVQEQHITEGLRKGIDALRENCRFSPIVLRVTDAYPHATIPGLDEPAASGERQVPLIQLH